MRRNGSWKLRKAVMVLAMIVLATIVFGYGTKWLWNWLMPGLFGLRSIGFAQAIGLLALSKILFGGFRGRPGWGRGRDRWREGMKERWEQMTPEDRERFRTGMRGRRNWCSERSRQAERQPGEQTAERNEV